MSLYQLQREQVKDKILEISIQIFRDKGYENATIDEITKTVGIAKGTFYNFYNTKKEILMTWAEKRFISIPFHIAYNSEKTLEENLYQFIDILIDAIKDERVLFKSLLKEFIRAVEAPQNKDQFNFIQIYQRIMDNSSDADAIVAFLPDIKIEVLNSSLFMGIMNWFDLNDNTDGLDVYLKNVVCICMNGIRNVTDK